MSGIILFFSVGLFIYWLCRSWLLAFGQEAEIAETLDADYWRWRNVLFILRTMLLPPTKI
jgi:hypothetical protein